MGLWWLLVLPSPSHWAAAFPAPALPPAINTPSSCCPKLGKAPTNPSPPTFFLGELCSRTRLHQEQCWEPGGSGVAGRAEPGWEWIRRAASPAALSVLELHAGFWSCVWLCCLCPPIRFPGDVPVWDGAAGGPAVAPQGSFFSAAGNEEEEELSLRSWLLFCAPQSSPGAVQLFGAMNGDLQQQHRDGLHTLAPAPSVLWDPNYALGVLCNGVCTRV